MRNVQIQETSDGVFTVKAHHGDSDTQATFTNADDALDFVGTFFRKAGKEVTVIAEMKSKIKEFEVRSI